MRRAAQSAQRVAHLVRELANDPPAGPVLTDEGFLPIHKTPVAGIQQFKNESPGGVALQGGYATSRGGRRSLGLGQGQFQVLAETGAGGQRAVHQLLKCIQSRAQFIQTATTGLAFAQAEK